jgi:TolB-like protein/Tfp pilus assembly protein PilF
VISGVPVVADRRFYQFGSFRLDASGRFLFRGNAPIPLPPKAVETLVLLVENAGAVMEKEQILKQVWKDAFVEEGSLTRTISLLRKALEKAEHGQEYIATVSKRGYRFVAEVTEAGISRAHRGRLMLAVLPFNNISGDPKQDYFSDGLTEEMITQLSRLNQDRLGVIARTSAMRYKGTVKSIREIGAELGVSHVLEGSVRRESGRVRIAAQLIQVSDESHLWAQSYERNLGDILMLQSEVCQAIAREVQIKLSPREELRLASAQSVSPSAYEAYLRGRHLWNKRTEDGMRRSISFYEDAIRLHPDYAMAYAGIADSYVMLACRGMAPVKETFRKARTAAAKALRLDPELGDAQGSLAHVRLHDWDWDGLEADFRRAVELNPAQGIVYYWFAEFLMSLGRPEEAIALAETAYQSDPLSPLLAASLGMINYLARKYDRALAIMQYAKEINPDHFLPYLRIGYVCVQLKQYDEAICALRSAVDLADRSTETLAALALAYAAAGNESQAQAILAELEKPAGAKRYVMPYNLAKIYSISGNAERAFDCLEIAYKEGNPDLIELNSEPVFDPIRSDSRFSDLMRRVGWDV